MAKDNSNNDIGNDANSNNNNLSSTPSTSSFKRARSKPYDANNSFVKKVATKVSDLIPQRSWIRNWFNSSQDESELQNTETDNPQYDMYEDKQSQPPPSKRPCIRMDVTYPPGTFTIKKRNSTNEEEPSKEQFSNHNETTQDFLEPTASGLRLHRFVASTPAYPMNTGKVTDPRSSLNMLMSEQNNVATNGTDDNSESSESTSGCSSLIPQNNRQEAPTNTNYNSPFGNKRRFIDEKLSFTNHLQSPRSLFLDNTTRETLSSRRPSFNPSVVNNSLDRSATLSSPFYAGNTMFGGANAANLYKRSGSVLSDVSYHMKAPQRTTVEVKSNDSTTSDQTGMSHTARRILEALEQFSSPISDAKKIPLRNVMDGSRSSMLDSTLNCSSMLNRKRQREEETASPRVGLRHLTRELSVPTVPDLLRIRRRQKLQNTTVNARKIMSARSAPSTSTSQDYYIRSETEKESEPKGRSQLKASKKRNVDEQEIIEPVNLPTMPLPISNLPRFDISLPQCTKPVTPERSQKQHLQLQQTKFDKVDAFKFASPIKLADEVKNLESINNFTFSKPISPSRVIKNVTDDESSHELSKTLSIDSNETLSTAPSIPNFTWTGPLQTQFKPKEKRDDLMAVPKVASELKTGSVMDFFAKQPAIINDSLNVWECNECLIKNNTSEKNCVACKSSKPAASDTSDDIEILECPSDDQGCKTRTPSPEDPVIIKTVFNPFNNKISNIKKFNAPDSIPSANTPLFNSTSTFGNEKLKSEMFKAASMATTTSIFGSNTSTIKPSNNEKSSSSLNAFKPVKSSWECPCCMVRNVETVTTCPCCNTAKPGTINVSPKRTNENATTPATTVTSSFGDKFKKPEGTWSCDTCLIQNKPDVNKCAACETPRPGATKSAITTPAITITSSFGDKFKKPEGSWSCDTCMVQNKSDVTKCVACETVKPGCESSEKSSSKLQLNSDLSSGTTAFKFGIDKANESAANLPKTNGFTFGSTAASPPTGSFNFGIPNNDKIKETKENDTKSSSLNFKASETVAATVTFQFGAKPIETKEKEAKKSPAAATFSFGMPAKSDAKPTDTFAFGALENKEKNENKVASTGFTFGSPVSVSKDSESKKGSKTTSEVPPTSNFVFGTPKPDANLQTKEPAKKENSSQSGTPKVEQPKVTPCFGTPVSEQQQQKPAATATFSFGTPTVATTTSSSSTTGLFGFPSKSTESTPLPAFGSPAAPKPVFSFGKTTETTTSTPQPLLTESKTPAMTFGSPAVTSSFPSQTNQTTSSLFGASATSATNTSENKPLMFGTPSENKMTFGEPENKIPAFGTSTADNKAALGGFSAPVTASATPTFGSSANATSSPFGSASTNVFGNSTPSTFGSNASSSIFSTTKSSETTSTNSGLFTFGQSSQSAAPSTGGFNFSAGSNANTSSDQKPAGIFTFGASSNNNTATGNGFNGGSFRAPTPAATSNFTFNAPPKPEANATSSAFGQPASTPMFNSPSTQPASGGFNFSSNMPNSFNFSSNAAPSTSGGFSFNAPSNPPAFDPTAAPSFNFTASSGAPPVFNAPPTLPTAPPGRKIKKAVRRMPRQ